MHIGEEERVGRANSNLKSKEWVKPVGLYPLSVLKTPENRQTYEKVKYQLL